MNAMTLEGAAAGAHYAMGKLAKCITQMSRNLFSREVVGSCHAHSIEKILKKGMSGVLNAKRRLGVPLKRWHLSNASTQSENFSVTANHQTLLVMKLNVAFLSRRLVSS